MTYCAPVLLVGVLVQFAAVPVKRWVRVAKMGLWFLGWLAWFMGGTFSFGHALS
jgi:hypothetical protein